MRHSLPTKIDAFQPANLNELSVECLQHRRDEYRRILSMFAPYSTPEARSLKELLENAIQSINHVLEQRCIYQIEESIEI